MNTPNATLDGALLSARARRADSSQIRELLHLTERPDMLSLAGGLPAPESLPVARVREVWSRAVSEHSLQYGATEGIRPLRELVADEHGVSVDEVLITTGSQQALDLLARALIDDGDDVAVESPAYLGATQAFANAGAHVRAIAGDRDGMSTDALAHSIATHGAPKIVYVVANFHNPTGATLSAVRRSHLATLAARDRMIVIDDDPYGALRFRGSAPPPIAGAVRLGTASKVLAPGLRVGWMIGPRWLIDACARLKQATDLHTSTLAQYVTLELLRDREWFDGHVRSIRDLYAARAGALTDALREWFGTRLVTHPVDGGLFTWIRFADGTDTTALLEPALARGVAFVPGAAFSLDDTQHDAARLCFATLTVDRLREAVARLAAASAERAIEIHEADREPEHDDDAAQLARR